MVRLEDAVAARMKTHGEIFEVLVEPDGALALKRGESIDLGKVLAVEDVFENATRGDRSPEEDLLKAFGTTDVYAIAEIIIKKGEISLTSEQRKTFVENRRKQVVEIIARNAINPQTKTPHPPARIEQAMKEAHVNIDLNRSVDEQVNITMKAIRPLIPIRFEEVDVAVKIPAPYAPKAYSEIASFGKLVKEAWQNNGSWIGVIKIPAGMQDDFYSLVNKLTKGEAETKLIKH
ncbi:MAG: ribosome assembly factor SBDS [Methanotrichaceae archaeon]|jgi:ribosome maturation protein SDO1|nr:ribosome assembly factor SBDS [Methanotrichaceae archaeon]